MINSVEDLNKEIVQLRTALQTVEAEGRSAGERASVVERGVGEVKQALQALREEAIATKHAEYRATNVGDAEVERAYTVRDPIPRAHAKSLDGVSYDSGVSYVGNVRMIGHTTDDDHAYGLLDDPNPKSDWQRELQTRAQRISLYRMMTGQRQAPKLERMFFNQLRKGPSQISKVFADNSGEGAEFIPDMTLPEVMAVLRTASTLASQFQRTQLPTGGATINPFETSGLQPFIAGIPASGDLNPAELVKSVPVLTTISASPKTIAVVLPSNMDATEDSIIEHGSYAIMSVADALRDGEEDAIVNGDTAGTHQDTGLAAWAGPQSRWATLGHSNDHRKAWIGLRARAFDVSNTADKSAAQTVADAVGWRSTLAGACRQKEGLIYVISLGHLIAKWLTDSNYLTVDKAGPLATNMTGAVGAIGGLPVHVSDYVTEDLNASGLFDNSTTDYTTGLLVQTKRFQIAERRGARIETERSVIRHTVYTAASIREVFRPVSSATEKNVYCAYKLSKS